MALFWGVESQRVHKHGIRWMVNYIMILHYSTRIFPYIALYSPSHISHSSLVVYIRGPTKHTSPSHRHSKIIVQAFLGKGTIPTYFARQKNKKKYIGETCWFREGYSIWKSIWHRCLHNGVYGPFSNLPFGICAIYFDLTVSGWHCSFVMAKLTIIIPPYKCNTVFHGLGFSNWVLP